MGGSSSLAMPEPDSRCNKDAACGRSTLLFPTRSRLGCLQTDSVIKRFKSKRIQSAPRADCPDRFFFFPRRLNAFNVVFWQHFQLLSTLISRGKRYHLQVSKSKDYVSLSVTAGERGSLQPMSPEWQAGANYRTYGNVFLLFFLFFLVLSHFGPCSESSVTVRQAVIISARMELMYSSSFANPTWWCCTGRELKDLVWDHFVGF